MKRHKIKVSKLSKKLRAGVLMSGLVILAIGQACTARTGTDVPLPDFTEATFDFSPTDGTYDLQSRVGQGSPLKAEWVEFYEIDLVLDNPADRDYDFRLQVMAGSTRIGRIDVAFERGGVTPSLSYPAIAGAPVTPEGITDTTDGTFWLVCTVSNPPDHTLGNAGRITYSNENNVRLRVGANHEIMSATHQVKCEGQPVR